MAIRMTQQEMNGVSLFQFGEALHTYDMNDTVNKLIDVLELTE